MADSGRTASALHQKDERLTDEDLRQPRRPTARKLEWITVFLLPLGGIVIPVLGWLVGVVLLWASKVWTFREKVLGTLLVPGGLADIPIIALVAASSETSCGGGGGHVAACTSSAPPLPNLVSVPLLAILTIAALATPVFLGRRAKLSHA
jgi:hypothetical protein